MKDPLRHRTTLNSLILAKGDNDADDSSPIHDHRICIRVGVQVELLILCEDMVGVRKLLLPLEQDLA